MAGDWIKWTKGLAWKPEVMAMAEALGLDQFSVAGRCMEVWEWADENLSGKCPACVLSMSGVDALARHNGFAAALIKVGWLKCLEDGRYAFPHFDRHNGKTAKTRALDTLRKFRSRSGKCPDHKRTKTGPEKRREDIYTPPTPPGGGSGSNGKMGKPRPVWATDGPIQ